MSEKYCVYDEAVGHELIKIGRDTYASIQQVMEKYPTMDFTAILYTACHRAATVATNAALGYPLDRKETDSPEAEGRRSPDVGVDGEHWRLMKHCYGGVSDVQVGYAIEAIEARIKSRDNSSSA